MSDIKQEIEKGIDINNLKHWQKVEDGELAGYYVQLVLGIQLNSTAMAHVAKEAEAERIQLEKLGHKVATIQPKGDYTSYDEAMAKIKGLDREGDLDLLELLSGDYDTIIVDSVPQGK
ncbi:hypothetical protein GCM10007938_33540 [Vibrio zhanjiangensis]|uniref:Uncharacterized protein n=1 Tax=Vibrio zhanjiangensis TaxID=1046128 RepID=A0ABQ6F4H1_9VIBR|nr:hypothetical protein GCM10007938_33540 [Vibrio zhanjiangensis]